MTDTEKLMEAIKGTGYSKEYIADKLNLSVYSLYKKINNKSEFKASEIIALSLLLNLTSSQRDDIFFNLNVD